MTEEKQIDQKLAEVQRLEYAADKAEEALYEAANEKEAVERWRAMKQAQATYLAVSAWFTNRGFEVTEELGNSPAENQWIVRRKGEHEGVKREIKLRNFRTYRE